ncbi:peptidylprolyl isomerase [Anditalea andensis]|uniref:Peptidyl-prolyl cis-trans isomerase n=1 Tax=Anditalea andensis TaxID=1048983 RepID=A0A074KTM6_9BACT|nr:peptidylprolyl isomerase [Anditalea andensis]KEO73326.1 peptidylprolyl isomerase [Anditalea andensis]
MPLRLFQLMAMVLLVAGCATEKDYLITIETRHGNMYAVLFDDTPQHKQNFIDLAQSNRYDSTEFQRVIENFMIQGGDVFSKDNTPQDQQYTVAAEIQEDRIHAKGNIAAARQGDNINPNRRSSGTQFYIVQGRVYDRLELTTDMKRLQESFMRYTQLESNKPLQENYRQLYEFGDFNGINQLMLSHKEEMERFFNTNLDKKLTQQQIDQYTTVGGTPHLDNAYTVFGKVVEGLEVLDKIAAEPTDRSDRPREPVYMKVKVDKIAKSRITKDYGYEYAH